MLRAGPARVRVPATSANLGPGFDCLGLAIALYDDVAAQVRDEPGLTVDVHGEEAATLPRGPRHLVVKALTAGLRHLGARPRGLSVVCANRIPHGRGLGSSAAAITAGLVLARGLVVGGEERMPDGELLALATQLEGHADNVAAALFGGLTIAWTEATERGPWMPGQRVERLRLDVTADVVPVVCVPASKVSTSRARALLPDLVPIRDASANIARTALLVQALTGAAPRPDLLLTATEDRLHQGYRRAAYPRSVDLVDKLRARGIAAVISGAGPTVLALTARDRVAETRALAGARFEVTAHEVDRDGATLL